jgi:cytochrome P450
MTVEAPARFNPFSAEFRRDPYPVYRALRETRPVHKTMGMWVLTRHADIRAVLRDRTFSAGLIPELVSRQAARGSVASRPVGATAHLALGHGMHGCLGGPLAQLQAAVAFDCLYREAVHVELTAKMAELEWQDHSFIVRGLKRLPVSLRGAA